MIGFLKENKNKIIEFHTSFYKCLEVCQKGLLLIMLITLSFLILSKCFAELNNDITYSAYKSLTLLSNLIEPFLLFTCFYLHLTFLNFLSNKDNLLSEDLSENKEYKEFSDNFGPYIKVSLFLMASIFTLLIIN